MRTLILSFVIVLIVALLAACSRSITVEQAANGKARCGKNYLR